MSDKFPPLYVILTERDTDQLAKDINKMLAEGWICVGGVSMVALRDHQDFQYTEYAQAMLKP